MISSMENKKTDILLLSLILIYPWFFIALQGIDMSDTGYWLVAYQNFFNNPAASVPLFSSWLTLLFGAGTNSVLGWMGFFGFKFANIVVLYALLFIAYLMLRAYINKTSLLFFLFLAMIFGNIDQPPIIFYYNLTALFFLSAGALLYFGLLQNRLVLILAAGFLLGVNLFIRFPNLLGIGLILVVIYYDLAKGNSKIEMLKKSMFLTAGYTIGVVMTLYLMHLLGHYELYIGNITDLLMQSKDPNFHHSSSGLLTKTLLGHLSGFIIGFILLLAFGALAWFSRFWNHSKIRVWGSAILFSFILVMLLVKIAHYDTKTYFWIYPGMIGILLIVLLWMAFKLFRERPELGTLAVIAYLIIEMIPLGSNVGFRAAVYGLYLALPLVLIYLSSLTEIKIGAIRIKGQEVYFLKVFVNVVLLIFLLVIGNIYHAAYHDGRSRSSMLSTVDDPKLRGTFTTKERAETLDDLLKNLKPYLEQYDSLLAYEYLATIYYITEAKPFLDSSWPYLYVPAVLEKKLENGIKERGLPLVLRAKSLTKKKGWPKISKPVDITDPAIIKDREILQDFLDRNRYQTAWKNKDFEILVPAKDLSD